MFVGYTRILVFWIFLFIKSSTKQIQSIECSSPASTPADVSSQPINLWCSFQLENQNSIYTAKWFRVRSFIEGNNCPDSDYCESITTTDHGSYQNDSSTINNVLKFSLEFSLSPKTFGEYFIVVYTDHRSQTIGYRHQWKFDHQISIPFKDIDLPVRTIVGHTIQLECLVFGYPVNSITWKNDSLPIENNDRVSYSAKNGLANSVLTIKNPQTYDANNYQCFASQTSTKMILKYNIPLYVIDKLAPLWPFLGILMQLVALFLIIGFVREPRRKGTDCEPLIYRLNKANTLQSSSVSSLDRTVKLVT